MATKCFFAPAPYEGFIRRSPKQSTVWKYVYIARVPLHHLPLRIRQVLRSMGR